MRVLLAAGLVFGVGAFATLAAWTDTENATGSFGASVFGTESQSAGSPTYTSQTAAPGASLTFNATAMSPGTSFYAWLNVRTTPASTVGGTVALTGIANNAGGLVGALQYRAVRTASVNPTSPCDATAFTGTPVFIAGAAATYLQVTAAVPASPVASPIAAAGGAIGYCFEVRVAPGSANTYQGTTATVTWTFTSTSAS
ncbi:SipW-dependent-type signal peptide-containing protein [Microbacterium sulfonylureivorans]|uniref:SipW-dependent-type signal peptide-containing protein n=1 Tax=Microbacterium sulfonylureivorans TaxID=2486854 RepID=UPI0013E0A129|nr:SipW-dependent-type signal peptide-containing protein [Microbacterium sulfonylureivorans]